MLDQTDNNEQHINNCLNECENNHTNKSPLQAQSVEPVAVNTYVMYLL